MEKNNSSLIPVVVLGQVYKQGGVATCIEEIIRAFAKEDREISLLTLTNPHDLSEEVTKLVHQSKNIHVIHLVHDFVPFVRLVKNSDNSIIISNLYYSALLIIFRSDKKFHILHGWGAIVNGLPQFLIGNLSNMVGSWLAHKTIANSYHTALVGRIFGINVDTIIPLGIPKSRLAKDSDLQTHKPIRDIDLLYVGRFSKIKKVPLLIKSFQSLSNLSTSTLNLHIVGGKMSDLDLGFDLDESVSSNIYFHGFTDNQALMDIYQRSKVFISLHPDEPFGLTFVEALAQGTPIIASKGSGIAPFINEEMGFTVNIDEESICRSISSALNKKWDHEYIQKTAFSTFSWDKIKDYIEAQ